MSQLDEGSPSLDEGSEGTAGFSFYRQAAAESKERNPFGNTIWKDVWEKRRVFIGKFYGRLHLNTEEKTDALLLTEGKAVLAHPVNVGWIKGKKRSFPNRENVQCKAWTLDDKGRWKQTGRHCPLCIFLGREPRLLVLWAVLDSREEQDPSNNRTTKWNLKYMAVDSDDVRDMIFNACGMASQDAGIAPTTRFAQFVASRTSNEKSSAYGTSWIFRKFYQEKEAFAVPAVKAALEKLPPWSETWPSFKSTVMVEMCKTHKKIFDEHNLDDRDGYSREGALKVIGADAASTGESPNPGPSLDEGDPTPTLDGGPSLEESGPSPVPQGNRPTLDDLAGEEANPENPPSPSPEPAPAPDDDDDDWVPYDDPKL